MKYYIPDITQGKWRYRLSMGRYLFFGKRSLCIPEMDAAEKKIEKYLIFCSIWHGRCHRVLLPAKSVGIAQPPVQDRRGRKRRAYMKNIKKYFNMIITAVICFAMGFVPGKKANAKAARLLADGQAVSRNTKRKALHRRTDNVFMMNHSNVSLFSSNGREFGRSNSPDYYLKKVFFWLQGPGDMKRGSWRSRSPDFPPALTRVERAGCGWGEEFEKNLAGCMRYGYYWMIIGPQWERLK